ncbi:Rv3654c family TadE-like protein [Nocardioides sp. Bht2]|uniref:Rv3654c family TadE-like protein n=1 Tax=Nocardioides sp. Bht2 TaxID=3392297 RepID=UPI0039B3E19D
MSRSLNAEAERGAVTLLVVMMSAVLTLCGVAGAYVAAVTSAHRAAQSAADLSALAAAVALSEGADPCAEAAAIAVRNRAHLTACRRKGEEVWVEVGVTIPAWGRGGGTAIGRARAGPAEPRPSPRKKVIAAAAIADFGAGKAWF